MLYFWYTHRLKGPQKGKSGVKSSQKSKKVPPKARVVWKDNAEQQGQATNTDAKSANADQPKLNGSGSKFTNLITNLIFYVRNTFKWDIHCNERDN